MPPPRSCFLDLPTELRLQIYDLLCPEPENEPDGFDTTQALRLVKSPLLQTCSRVRAEAIDHHFGSRVIAAFVNSPRCLDFDFLFADVAYDAISRVELNIFCSLDQYMSRGDALVVTDWQKRVIEVAFGLVRRARNLTSLSIHCSVFRGVVQLPRRREFDLLLGDLDVFDLPKTLAVDIEWSHATETKPRANLSALELAVTDCEASLRRRLPGLQCTKMRWLDGPSRTGLSSAPRIQTGSNFGRRPSRSKPP